MALYWRSLNTKSTKTLYAYCWHTVPSRSTLLAEPVYLEPGHINYNTYIYCKLTLQMNPTHIESSYTTKKGNYIQVTYPAYLTRSGDPIFSFTDISDMCHDLFSCYNRLQTSARMWKITHEIQRQYHLNIL